MGVAIGESVGDSVGAAVGAAKDAAVGAHTETAIGVAVGHTVIHARLEIGTHPRTRRRRVVASVAHPVCVAKVDGFHGTGAGRCVSRVHRVLRIAIVKAAPACAHRVCAHESSVEIGSRH